MESDAQLVSMLDTDPEQGMALIMEQYGGLVWAAAASRLASEQDVRECVNDTFAEFYFRRARYDPAKGPLGTWLAHIARRRAVDKWRAQRRFDADELPEDAPARSPLPADDRLDLVAALARLSPEDAELLRLKYFAGMTAKEIAAALDLPYETVKKRQQRSLAKLRRLLVTGLVLALLALLAACGYVLLRYFGVLPGYGVNTDAESPFTVLAEDVSAENGFGRVELTDALWNGDRLILTLRLVRGPDAADKTVTAADGSEVTILWSTFLLSDVSLSFGGNTYGPPMTITDTAQSTPDCLSMQMAFDGVPKPEGETADASLELSWLSVPFTLAPADETAPDAYSYALGELGGVLAVPAPSDAGFALELYPMDAEPFSVSPGIVTGICPPADADTAVTLTDAQGRVTEGEPSGFSPYGTSLYSRWEFGALEPGEYTLHIPCLLVTAPLPGDLAVPVADGERTEFDVPGAHITAEVSGELPPGVTPARQQADGTQRFFVSFGVQTERDDLVFAGLMLSARTDAFAPADFLGPWTSCTDVRDETGAFEGLCAEFAEEALVSSPRLVPGFGGTAAFVWTQPFDIGITVP